MKFHCLEWFVIGNYFKDGNSINQLQMLSLVLVLVFMSLHNQILTFLHSELHCEAVKYLEGFYARVGVPTCFQIMLQLADFVNNLV